jgi:hypothetical protein
MFSLSQYVIIGLAGSVYLAGAAILLTGGSFLRNCRLPILDAEREQTATSGAVEELPYFFPVLEKERVGSGSSIGPLLPEGEKMRSSHGDLSADRRAVEHRSENAESDLLTSPICLN